MISTGPRWHFPGGKPQCGALPALSQGVNETGVAALEIIGVAWWHGQSPLWGGLVVKSAWDIWTILRCCSSCCGSKSMLVAACTGWFTSKVKICQNPELPPADYCISPVCIRAGAQTWEMLRNTTIANRMKTFRRSQKLREYEIIEDNRLIERIRGMV